MPYSGVVTTGIYCRAGCPAQPDPRNVRTYRFPAGAEAAGFRPCLRCRPDRAGPAPTSAAPSELVCRALHLIEDGALDGATTAVLARRLGVSDRHLRRLFDQHVGASPDAVARSRRAHFARRLLDETDLGVADIAFAAGFQSLRQMNRVMADTFRFTPTELRRRRRAGDLLPGAGLRVRVPYRPPLAFTEVLGFLAARAVPALEQIDVGAGTYRRVVAAAGAVGTVTVSLATDRDLLVDADIPSYRGFIHVVERIRRVFDLACDPEVVDAHLGRDHTLGPLVRATPGRRLPGCWDTFELLVRAVVGQQVTVAGASTLAARIVHEFGPRDPRTGAVTGFPAPDVIAGAELERCGLTRQRAATLRHIAGAVAAGDLDVDAPVTATDLTAALTALPGIGPWTASYVAMRLGHGDVFPASDLALRKALGDGTPVDSNAAAAAAEAWRPWRSYAAMHLWASVPQPVRIRPDAEPVPA